MKAVIISIKPRHCVNILDGTKKEEIRRTCLKDWKDYLSGKTDVKPESITVLVYCTRNGRKVYKTPYGFVSEGFVPPKYRKWKNLINGKVIARFTLNKVEEIKYHFGYYDMGEWTESYILENACLTPKELDDYLKASKEYDDKKISRVYGYAWHIDDLEIFYRLKELKEFKHCTEKTCIYGKCHKYMHCLKPLTKPFQSWGYVEADE